MPHSTTRHGGKSGPWLVSLVMYSNCMQFVGEDRVGVSELEELAGTKTNLNGMERWGYITVDQGRIHATAKGRKAQEVWRPLFDEIEKRWEERFGKNEIDHLRASLRSLKLDDNLPDCLPISGLRPIQQRAGTKGSEAHQQRRSAGTALSRLIHIRHGIRARVRIIACDQRQRRAHPGRKRHSRPRSSSPQRRVERGDRRRVGFS